MTNIRRQKNKNKPYVQLFRENFQIPTLSFEAKGLWAYLMSLPEDWRINVNHLTKTFGNPECGDFRSGRKRILRMLKELKNHKLCVFEQERVNGKWCPGDYVVFDDEIEFKKYLPESPQRRAVERATVQGSPYYTSTTNTNNISNKEKKKEREKVVAKAPPPPLISFGEYKRVKITQKDYDSLCNKFGKKRVEEQVIRADNWLEANGQTKKNYKAFMQNWMLRPQYHNLQAQKEDLQEKNKEYATKIVKTLRKNNVPKEVKLYIASSYMEIGAANHPTTQVLMFTENGFKEQLDNILRKMNLIKYLT